MGIPYTAAHGTVRFSLSRYNTMDEMERVIAEVPSIVAKLRKLSPYWGEAGPLENPEQAFAPVYAWIRPCLSTGLIGKGSHLRCFGDRAHDLCAAKAHFFCVGVLSHVVGFTTKSSVLCDLDSDLCGQY